MTENREFVDMAHSVHEERPTLSTEEREAFKIALVRFKGAANDLVAAWGNQLVWGYPDYLPSFDEFAADFAQVSPK